MPGSNVGLISVQSGDKDSSVVAADVNWVPSKSTTRSADGTEYKIPFIDPAKEGVAVNASSRQPTIHVPAFVAVWAEAQLWILSMRSCGKKRTVRKLCIKIQTLKSDGCPQVRSLFKKYRRFSASAMRNPNFRRLWPGKPDSVRAISKMSNRRWVRLRPGAVWSSYRRSADSTHNAP